MKIRKNAVTGSGILGASLISSLALLAAPAANAEVVVYAWDNGSDVSFDWGGSLNFDGLTSVATNGGFGAGISPGRGQVQLSSVTSFNKGYDTTFSAPDGFSGPSHQFMASPIQTFYWFDTGSYVQTGGTLAVFQSRIFVDFFGTSGPEFSGKGTVVNSSLAAMGVVEGNYRFTLANSDYLEIRFGEAAPAPVPVPPALGLMAAGLAGLVAKRRKA